MSVHPLNDIDAYEAKNKRKPSEILMDAFRFTEDDLVLNQQGKMSVNQRLRCLTRRNLWLVGVVICTFGFLIILLGNKDSGFLLASFAVGICVCGFNARRFHIDATKGIAIVLEGRVKLEINGRSFSLIVDGYRFDVKQKIFLAFKNGDPYRVYYTPRSKILLSAEWLRD